MKVAVCGVWHVHAGEYTQRAMELGRQVVTHVDCSAGGVAFYDGADVSPADAEAMAWIDAIVNDTEQIVKPEQACVVSEILEAIYVSSETGKPVYFE